MHASANSNINSMNIKLRSGAGGPSNALARGLLHCIPRGGIIKQETRPFYRRHYAPGILFTLCSHYFHGSALSRVRATTGTTNMPPEHAWWYQHAPGPHTRRPWPSGSRPGHSRGSSHPRAAPRARSAREAHREPHARRPSGHPKRATTAPSGPATPPARPRAVWRSRAAATRLWAPPTPRKRA